MRKIIGRFSLIMLVNLFAFLSIGYMLDLKLNTGTKYKIIFLVLSIISLMLLSKNFFKKALKDIKNTEKSNNK